VSGPGDGGVELVLDTRARIGEGPIWDPRDGTLVWVDITSNEVHKFDPRSGQDRSWNVGRPVGAAAVADAGGLVLALEDGFGMLDLASGRLEMIARVEADLPTNRMNDGKCDSSGRFWAGTMPYEWQANPGAGSLYRLGVDRSVERMLDGITISNGLGWSLDDRLMYYVDSPTRRLDVFDYDAASGAITNRRPLVEIDRGLPDGLTIDEEGCIWLVINDAWEVRRYTPDGQLDRTLHVPTSLVASCTFGGDDLGDLYIATIRHGLSDEALKKEPHAGGLFRCRPGVKGVPPSSYKG
jgi:sugar lactone lactonase YvrE